MTTNATLASEPTRASVTFWGAAQQVTGSMHLLEAGHQKFLLDCGLYQGTREESRKRNARLPFDASSVEAVLVSHAHIDHCGNLPTLVRNGFDGPIYTTPASKDLLGVMLVDSAKIQEEDAAYLNISKHKSEAVVQPLYTRDDVEQVLRQCSAVPFEQYKQLTRGIRFKFVEAGHVLGSAMVHLRVQGESREHSMTFTGDLGRRFQPLLRPSAPIPPADVVVCESTYGNRVHEPVGETVKKLYETIRRTVERGGTALIPAFSLGRTQLIIHYIQQGIIHKKIPTVPVYVDSPLAADITAVYERHPECLTEDAQRLLSDGTGILGGGTVEYIREYEESLRLTHRRPGPKVIIASSGMCDAGRIVGHLKHYVDDPRCTVILVSYQAHGTTGRRLVEPGPKVRIQGKEYNKWIDVVHLDGFSGHADKDDFMSYFEQSVGKIGKIRLIHGETEQAEALSKTLKEMGFGDVAVPKASERVEMS